MIRSRPFQHAMTRLALCAMLLLALLPTIGRLSQSSAQAGDMAFTSMCTAAGMTQVPVALFGSDAAAPSTPERHLHPDCDYCPLLASLVFALAVLMVLLRGDRIAPIVLRAYAIRRNVPHPCGLGSRGPPLVL